MFNSLVLVFLKRSTYVSIISFKTDVVMLGVIILCTSMLDAVLLSVVMFNYHGY